MEARTKLIIATSLAILVLLAFFTKLQQQAQVQEAGIAFKQFKEKIDVPSISKENRAVVENADRTQGSTQENYLPYVNGGNLTIDSLVSMYKEINFSAIYIPNGIQVKRKSTTVKIKKHNDLIKEIFLTGVSSKNDHSNVVMGMGVAIALGATTSWGVDWYTENLPYVVEQAVESGTRRYAKSHFQDNVFIRLEVNLNDGSITLEIEPYEKGGNR